MRNKNILTIRDFDRINWHDCKIYGIAFDDSTYNFYFDIDFIFEWIEPINEEGYMFNVAPATLIFHNVWDISLNIETSLSLNIDNIIMNNPHLPKNEIDLPNKMEYDWLIELLQGEISFKSIGFDLYIRQMPITTNMQMIDLKQRGGISFSIISEW